MARNSNSGTGSGDGAPALSADEVAELLDQSRAGAVEALEPRRLGRLTRQLQVARDQAKAADDQPQVKELAAALRRVKAETARRGDGEDGSAQPGKNAGKRQDAAGEPLKAPKARAATPAELPPLPPGAVPLAEGEASRSNLPPVRQPGSTGMESPAGKVRKQQKVADKVADKAERQRVKEAEKAERKRVKEAEKAEKKAERKAARKAEKAAAKG